jgi:hypothetical protein
MTFRLRRKRRTTRQSMAPWTGSSRGGRRRLIAALSLSLLAGSATVDSFSTANAAEPGGVRSYLSKTLQKFKGRSAEKRYEQYKAEHPRFYSAESANAEPGRLPQDSTARPNFADEPTVFVLVSQDGEQGNDGPSSVPPAPADNFDPRLFQSVPMNDAVGVDSVESAYQKVDADPRNLKSIRDIQPFHDYQPGTHIEQDLDPEFVAPAEVELGEVSDGARNYEAILYQWQASNLHHTPLYFQDPGLERYGHVHHELVQPFVSVGKFGLQLIGLPYQMTIDPVCKKQYALGWYSPGECAPKQTHQIPWNSTAALNEAAVVTGLTFAIP